MKTDDEVTSRFDPDRIDVEMDRDSITKSFQSPLYILNIKKEDIPNHLPGPDETYVEPTSCLVAKVEYDSLNKLLGIDEATLEAEEYGMISLDASDAIESTISDFIPFEDVIKYVSGASKHEKKVAAAFFRGQIRRAYLRGYIHRNTCETPVPSAKPTDATITASNVLAGDERRIGLIRATDSAGEDVEIYVSPAPRPTDEVVQLPPLPIDERGAREDTPEEPAYERASESDDRPAPMPMRAIASRD